MVSRVSDADLLTISLTYKILWLKVSDMFNADNIRDALSFPFEEDKWVGKAVIGSILALGSFLLIPAPLLIGYMMRVYRQDSMPEFNNYLDMYVEGLKAMLVVVLYIIPGFGIMAAFESNLAILGGLVFLVLYYSLESGLYQLANNGLRKAFTLQVLKDAFTLNYLLGAIVSVIVNIALFMAWGLSSILIIPVLLFPTVNFYQSVLRYRIIKEAIEAE